MRRSLRSAAAALVLVATIGGGAALAAPPVAPRLASVSATWAMGTYDDGSPICQLTANAKVDPGYTKGQPVFWHAYMHFQYVGPGGEPIAWRELDIGKLVPGLTAMSTFPMGFLSTGEGYYVVDGVRFELRTRSGKLLSQMDASATPTCLAGPG